MKNLKYLVIFSILAIGCSKPDDTQGLTTDDFLEEQEEQQQEEQEEEEAPAFVVEVSVSESTIVIDEIVQLTAQADEQISSISFSIDNGVTFGTELTSNFGDSASIFLDFETIGTKNIVFRVKNAQGEIVDTQASVEVLLGSAVQIASIQLNNFLNMGTSWDDEYPDDDPNRLADLVFALVKPALNNFDGTRSAVETNPGIKLISETRENETNLFWNIENENIFVNPDFLEIFISFSDDDGGGIGQDLMSGPPYLRIIPISDFIQDEPSIFTVLENDIDLDYEVMVNW